ncbi:putative disease resistance protein RGA3 [Olea europaea var. sylvestris]|uniref:putative disease resistance protein RGA3 n=1 Tax=Olea europaea var. sylvestris TaxID=158386 RepID=UPI000C1D8BBC|nr:putative disease resistance protein RGA3 [Olea europaea var. sylvestris]XP_022896186.1 putative disease resistance protein RGA3 [Olea europaea var. sylvestris]
MWESLEKKKFLVVLDDVWSEDHDDWDKLMPLFECGLDGSKILVTTRSQKAASVVGSLDTSYRLKGLSDDDCWKIFSKRASFTRTEEEKYPNLHAIGKELMPKCGGVPLAAKILGGLMRFKREEREWLNVQNSNLWIWQDYKKKILPVLLVSYMHLPPHLKHCFAFCSIFPKNYEIKREKLIHMWMALGLILPDGESKALEEIGDEYFNELVSMSVFEDVQEYEGGAIRRYKMNEDFQSLAQSLTENEYLVLTNTPAGNNLELVRHASIVSKRISFPIPDALLQIKHLRTLLVFSEGGALEECSDIFKNFRFLRMLDLSGCLVQLPSMNCLPLLKHLDLSNNHFYNLPKEISSLRSLLTLNLFRCYNLRSLPDLAVMRGLRHLNISGCEALKEMPFGIGLLSHLQTLPIYVVGHKCDMCLNRKQFFHRKCEYHALISHLKLFALKGELKIKRLERVDDVKQVESMPLMNKEYLESLGLCWGDEAADLIMNPALEANIARFQERKEHVPGPSGEPETHASDCDPVLAGEVLAGLQPHKNLKKMFIVGYPGIKFPHWVLPNLTEMVLINCRGCVQLPILGHLPFLRTLRMEGMDNIVHIGREFYGEDRKSFPSLQELFMIDFPSLQTWDCLNDTEKSPLLSKLVIRKCPNLDSLPLFRSLKHLEMQSCRSILLNRMEELTLLSTIIIEGFDDLSSLPENLVRNNCLLTSLKIKSCRTLRLLGSGFRCLTSLKSLNIRWCDQLSLPPEGFENLNALEYFEIIECNSIETLPENPIGGLISLQTLSIENCSKLSSISAGLQYLTALKHLTIMYCPNLAGLPDSLEHLSSLLSLAIINCSLIECLPESLQHVKTLQRLEIRNCQRIANLPEWLDSFATLRTLAISECPNIKSLPLAFQRLEKLQHLSIQDCPDLQRRCQRDRGEDWWKVSHVPHKYIFSSQ